MYPLVLAVFLALVSGGVPSNGASAPERFGRYWYQGKAELTRYELRQARYGEIHSGEAVLIFVTEPFLPDRQVKLERADPSKGVTVLKLNAVRKFFTGIYPYSLMVPARGIRRICAWTFSRPPITETEPLARISCASWRTRASRFSGFG